MKAEIICIGTELLLGHIVNSNASSIALRLAELGLNHYYQTTVGDNPKRLGGAVKFAIARSDITITTGGLGPTVDDITAKVIAHVLGKKLVLEKAVLKEMADYFRQQNKKIPKDSLRQALIPEGAIWVKNPFGTAPGLIIEQDKKIIIALPGPPREMNPMMDDRIVPYLKSKLQKKWLIKSKSIRLTGLPEAKVNEKVKALLHLGGETTLGIYARLGEVELKITTKAESDSAAKKEIARISKVIYKKFGKAYIYGEDAQTPEEIAGGLLKRRKKTLAVAESCTGGLLSDLITNVSGSSAYFKESVVTYSNESKIRLLGIPPDLIKKEGAVSAKVAVQMAKSIRDKSGAGIGIAVTGIAGPAGGTQAKPVGLVFIALCSKNKNIVKQFNFHGTRKEVKSQSARAALNLLRLCLQ